MSRKPSRTTARRIRDILEAVAEIRGFVAGMDLSEFSADAKTFKAVLADFAIIGEAAGHLPAEVEQHYPQVPWPQIRAMRNIVVHVYFAVEPRIVWDTIRNDFDPLETQLQRVLRDLEPPDSTMTERRPPTDRTPS